MKIALKMDPIINDDNFHSGVTNKQTNKSGTRAMSFDSHVLDGWYG